MYLWGKTPWPAFTWDETTPATPIAQVSREQVRLPGEMEVPGFDRYGGRGTSYSLLIK